MISCHEVVLWLKPKMYIILEDFLKILNIDVTEAGQ